MLLISRVAWGVVALIPFLAICNAFTIERRALVVPGSLPGGWMSEGCYVDVSGRTLTGGGFDSDTAMTDEACITYCTNQGFIYAGTEYSSQCYCGLTLAAGSGPADTGDCNMPCTGNSTEACGGPNRLNLFWSGTNGPQTNPGSGDWSFAGCYVEGTQGRALPNGVGTTGGSNLMTVDLCTSACQAAGYVLAGAEYSGECYCANTVQNGGGLASDGLAGCDMLCNGNKSEYCGGPGRLDLYSYSFPSAVTSTASTYSAPPLPTTTIPSSSLPISLSSSKSSSTKPSSSSALKTSGTTKSTTSKITTTTSRKSTTTTKSTTKSTTTTTTKTTAKTTAMSTTKSTTKSSSSQASSVSPSMASSSTPSSSSSSSSIPSVISSSSSSASVSLSSSVSTPSLSTTGSSSSVMSSSVTSSSSQASTPGSSPSSSSSSSTYSSSSSSPVPPSSSSSSTSSSISSSITSSSSSLSLISTSISITSLSSSTSSSISSSSLPSTLSSSSHVISSSPSSAPSSLSSSSSSIGSSTSSPIISTLSSTSKSTSMSSSSTSKSSSSKSTTKTSSTSKSSTTKTTTNSSSKTSSSSKSSTSSRSSTSTLKTSTSSKLTSSSFLRSGFSSSSISSSTLSSSSSSAIISASAGSSSSSSSVSSSMTSSSSSSSLSSSSSTLSSSVITYSTSSSPSASPTLGIKYVIGSYTYQGCYSEATTGRALSALATYDYTGMTLEECASSCSGYTYFGVEYGGECYCGNMINAGSVAQPTSNDCSFICPGSPYEYCGAGGRLEMYKNGAPSAITSSSIRASSSTPAAASSSTSGGPSSPTVSSTPPISGFTYQGCYIDGANGRILTHQLNDNQGMTQESCIAACSAAGYTIAGMEWSIQCYCDDAIYNGGVLAANQADCNSQCGGNQAEMCGGGSRLSLFSVGIPQAYVPPAIQKTNLPTNWTFSGCLEDNIPSNEDPNEQLSTFPYMVWNSATLNTPAACIAQCQTYGYNAAGLEYGSECFCGDVENIQVASAPGAKADPRTPQYYTRSRVPQLVDESRCNAPCSGDTTKLCGSGGLMSYYSWNGTDPLYTFNFPPESAAGAYSLLIDGVIVPLMTAQVVTGKVTFTEKFGAQESNSTGVYELDLSQVDNFSSAWRTMGGLQTDVSFSAGLILPDKAGRQLTVGGSSNSGIRFYWPDGSAGVQVPRAFPSAMIMANGSILIIGGENGNAIQPTLELLPSAGTAVYLDFLDRTAPYNLYPFVCVLPSGIFIAYYDEARILDENTFATIKTLPTMLGSINNPNQGRTYPVEGTMVLLPQHAPFTDNLRVLICGGSTTSGDDGDPIDNCISTAPEDPNPQWTLERMPSRRVLGSMVGLPDGTYVILNGAEHGKGGYGLGASPNYNAVLYDPSQPLNQRMSIMANTSIARLYHSEAIVLLDGRVLVSGSDPSGNYANPPDSFPEEYRVEVFTPPYLLSNLSQPVFSIVNKDWDYNETVSLTLTSGSTANFKVSMLGAVVNTHGNSMGQRTLFPSVSCAGILCTITTPPNAHVCPPGWYMLFAVDGPTPSAGQFIRIGKDPASIGTWPKSIQGIQAPGL